MDRNFTRSLGAVLEEEGGFANHPEDPGGATMRGVTFENFKRYVKPDGTIADLKAITAEQAGIVYRRFYWDAVLGAELPDGVDHSVFDYAVNSGPRRAAEHLQEVVGAKVDGKIGPETLKAVRAMDADMVITALNDRRLAFLRKLKTWDTFGKGWSRRVARVRKLSMELAAQPKDAPVVVEKHIDVDRPVPEPVIPKGAEKRTGLWTSALTGIGSVIASVWSAIADLPLGVKIGLGVVTLLAIGFMLFRGELVVRRVKAIVAEIGA